MSILLGVAKLNTTTKYLIVALIVLSLIAIVIASYRNKLFGNNGVLKTYGLNVYWDVNCTNEVIEIEWGDVKNGESYNRTVFVRNEGNQPLNLSLSILDEEWFPVHAKNYISSTWNRDGYLLSENEVIEALVVLEIDEAIQNVTNFSFTTLISG